MSDMHEFMESLRAPEEYDFTLDEDQRPAVPAQPAPTPVELSDYDIRMIHSGLLIPNEKAIHSMAREIRKWRGEANPDAV